MEGLSDDEIPARCKEILDFNTLDRQVMTMARVLGFDPAIDALYTDNLDVEFEMDAVGSREHWDEICKGNLV